MEWLLVWGGMAVAVGVVAAARNRSGFGWLVLSLMFSPVLAGLVLALLGRGDADRQAVTADTHRHCPDCREVVRRDARKCKHCGSVITTPPC